MTQEQQKELFDTLSEAKMRRDFVPFVIVLRDGQRHEVHDRWHVGFAEGNPSVVVLRKDQTHAPFRWSDIAVIQTLEPAAS